MQRIVVPGAAGRMGRALVSVICQTEGIELAAAIERPGHPDVGSDPRLLAGAGPGPGAGGVRVTDDFDHALSFADVVIDFTSPAATADFARRAAERDVALVVGTTGLGEAERDALVEAARRVPVVLSPNFSVGVNVLFKLLDLTARALGDDYDVEIVETHHRMKKDSPSGTAVRMAEVLAESLGRVPADALVYGREGQVGARTASEIGVLAVRGGDVIGDHTAHFLGLGERIEITHRATARDTFARGAVRAARWLSGKPAGLYDMQDVLGLR